MNIRSVIFAFIFLFIMHQSFSQVMWLVSKAKVTQYSYAGGDDFTGAAVDTSRWESSYPWGRNLYCNKEQQYYTNWKNHSIENGILRMEARKEQVTDKLVSWEPDNAELKCGAVSTGLNKRTLPFTSGMIFSKSKYHYGYFECRFKSSSGKGLWPAFWLFAGHESDEIDVFEIKGERNSELHVDVHCTKGCSNYRTTLGLLRKNWGDYLPTNTRWHEGFNVVGIEWHPDYIKWFLNGQAIAYWKGHFEYPMWVIANLAIPSDNGPFGPGPDAGTQFPAAMEIDYIRIWKEQRHQPGYDVIFEKPVSNQSRSVLSANHSTLVKKRRPEYKRSKLKEETVQVTLAQVQDGLSMISIQGILKNEFEIEVLTADGKQLYASKDPLTRNHFFNMNRSRGGILKMKVNDNTIEHRL